MFHVYLLGLVHRKVKLPSKINCQYAKILKHWVRILFPQTKMVFDIT